MESICRSTWAEFDIPCELEDDHTGPHTGIGRGKIGCWGGRIKEWVRA